MPTFIAQPNGTWRRWNLKHIFNPNNTESGIYVPNKNDIVVDTEKNIEYIVTDVDYVTGVSTLKIWHSRKLYDPVGITDHFVSAGTGTIQDTFRLLVDTSKSPFIANLDSRLYLRRATASYVVFYKGEDATTSQAQPISLYLPSSSETPTVKVPLIADTYSAGGSVEVRVPERFNVNQLVHTNDIVTMVVYDENDIPLSEKRLSVYDTKFVRKTNSAAKYVRSIQLTTAMLSENNNRLVEIPVNLDMNSIQFFVDIGYSDGSVVTLPVDGIRAKLLELDMYSSNLLGSSTPLTLRYIPSPGEHVATGLANEDGTITQAYTFRTIRGNERGGETPDAYAFKIFAYPRFVQATRRWTMEYYLSSITRDQIYYVTNLVEMYSGEFKDDRLGLMQRYVVRLNLRDVDSSFNNYYHTQEIVVTLISSGNEDYTPVWYSRDNTTQAIPYGENIAVRGTRDLGGIDGRWGLDFSVLATDLTDWLNKVYYSTKPLFDPYRDGSPLLPTHVRVKAGAGTQLAEISLTNTSVTTPLIVDDFYYARGELILFEFVRRTANGDLIISTSGMSLLLNN